GRATGWRATRPAAHSPPASISFADAPVGRPGSYCWVPESPPEGTRGGPGAPVARAYFFSLRPLARPTQVPLQPPARVSRRRPLHATGRRGGPDPWGWATDLRRRVHQSRRFAMAATHGRRAQPWLDAWIDTIAPRRRR